MNAFMDSWSSIFAHISAHAQDVREFLNSVFVTSVAGALAGAFFGAWGAQRSVMSPIGVAP